MLSLSAKPDIKAFETGMATALKQCALTLKTIADDELSLKETIQEQLTKKREQLNSAQSAIEKCMLSFKNDFPESTLELGTTRDYLDEYLALKAQIEQDDLPQHEKRFKQMMDDKIASAILIFKTGLERREGDYQRSRLKTSTRLYSKLTTRIQPTSPCAATPLATEKFETLRKI